ncbi:hypothetical protein C8R46DRAFT_1318562 [Mycena filopes]|nr:hypothetical protein C8R46DRAFT_1360806 [Mycena filopes]KAJ7180572.1 hypothetical protein C8R46DRAFT_1318562 [Mycena filopes]
MARLSAPASSANRRSYHFRHRAALQITHQHIANGRPDRALRVIGRRSHPPLLQLLLQLSTGDLYARDQPPRSGHVYFKGRVPDDVYRGYMAGTVSTRDFHRELSVKFGVAEDLPRRAHDYEKCAMGGERQLWFFAIPTGHRYYLERLLHLLFLCFGPRDRRRCSGCLTCHQEYWRLSSLGSFPLIRSLFFTLLLALRHHMNITLLPDWRIAF